MESTFTSVFSKSKEFLLLKVLKAIGDYKSFDKNANDIIPNFTCLYLSTQQPVLYFKTSLTGVNNFIPFLLVRALAWHLV